MKKTLYMLAVCGLSFGVAQADESIDEVSSLSLGDAALMHAVPLELPNAQNKPTQVTLDTGYNNVVTKHLTGINASTGEPDSGLRCPVTVSSTNVAQNLIATGNLSVGAYLMGNVNSGAFSGLTNEGKFANDNGIGSAHLYSRNGRAGQTLALVLDGSAICGTSISEGSSLTSLTLTSTPGTGAPAYWTTLAIVDTSTNTIVCDTGDISTGYSSTSTSYDSQPSVTLQLEDGFVWKDDYVVVAGIVGGVANTYNTGYDVNSIRVIAIPEPATATLSLLALAGLAARRRRK